MRSVRVAAALVVAVAAVFVRADGAGNQDIIQCQVTFAETLKESTSSDSRCAAVLGLSQCMDALGDSLTTEQQNMVQAFIDASQMVEDCSSFALEKQPHDMVVEDGNLEFKLEQDVDVRFITRRSLEDHVSIWRLRDHIEKLQKQAADMEDIDTAALNKLTSDILHKFTQRYETAKAEAVANIRFTVNALEGVMTSADAAAAKRVDSIVHDVYNTSEVLQYALSSNIESTDSSLQALETDTSTTLAEMLSATQDTITDINQEYIQPTQSTISAVIDAFDSQVNAVSSAATDSITQLNGEVSAATTALKASIAPKGVNTKGTVYTYWGRPSCGAGHRRLYYGIVYGASHGHSGAANQLCIPESPTGGSATGTDSLDLLYPLSLDNNHGTNLPRTVTYRCARCLATSTKCYEHPGAHGCPSGFTQIYTGYMVGSHYQHSSPAGRFCVDSNTDQSIGNSGYYVYASAIWRSSRNIASDRSIKCTLCCKN
eukprot:m.353476 g.353476  ORF g.353476 m.353476 type:complete len:486 (-) comp16771_c0_seq1:111-1568(-)